VGEGFSEIGFGGYTVMIDQIGIALTGVTAIGLSQSGPKLQRYACLFGLAGQPFWIYAAWSAGQWGILSLTALYTAAWVKGLYSHWIKPVKAAPNPEASFAYTQNHGSGYTLTVGFEKMDDAHRAHEMAMREFGRRRG
jgi:hypothetical protein